MVAENGQPGLSTAEAVLGGLGDRRLGEPRARIPCRFFQPRVRRPFGQSAGEIYRGTLLRFVEFVAR